MDGSMSPRSGRGLPFLAMTLTLGVAMLWGAPSPAFPAECASPIVTVFTAGVIDGFAAPNEPTSPSAELQAYATGPRRSFDQGGINRALIHTFTGLPTGIVGARLTVRLRAEGFADNDALHLELLPGPRFAWGQSVRTLTGVSPWVSPADRTVTLDLANLTASARGVTDVLSALADGDLDVYLQDDTAADYLQLEVSHCPLPSSLHLDWDVPFCAGQSKAVIEPEVCNNSSVEQSYNVSFAPDDDLHERGCNVPGPTSFQVVPPAALPFLVPPRSCRTLPVEVGRPPGFTASGEQSCFFVTAESVATGEVVETRGSVWDQRDVCVICDRSGATTDQPLGTSTPFTFDLRNTTAATRTVRWEALSMAPAGAPEVVSLDGQPPGTPIQGEVTIPAGQRRQVTVEAEMTRFERLAQDLLFLDRDDDSVLASASLRSFSPGCTPTGTDLCLNNGRFRVTVAWRDFDGNTGLGHAVPLTSDTGYFWFFDPANVEVVLKVLDGRSLTDSFWVFYGALSTVEYVVSVTDTETGVRKSYVNPSGNLASVADTEGLAVPVGASRAEEEEEEAPAALPQTPVFAAAEACSPGTGNLCLNGGRFKIEVEWKDFDGNTGSGQAVPLTGDTGYFWFFNAANVELIVKVLDGRSLNDHWWVFYGALSTVEYRVTVTDTATGNVKTYFNPSGTLASMADTSAFMD